MKSNHNRIKEFGDRLRELRGDKTVRAWCAKIGMDSSQWSGYETGREKPGFDKLHEIAEKTGKSFNYLLTGKERM